MTGAAVLTGRKGGRESTQYVTLAQLLLDSEQDPHTRRICQECWLEMPSRAEHVCRA
ncbi:MAG: hypothetical protein ACXVYY_01240 [Oryzihumus sp.]